MKSPLVRCTLLGLAFSVGAVAGCGGNGAGQLPPEKPYDASQTKTDIEKMRKMMGGEYKGAPNAPQSKGGFRK